MEWTQERINEIYLKIQKQAMVDEEFRKELLADPNGTIEKALGEKLPEGFKVNVVESDPAYNATFVLPDLLGDELEDEDLDQVAGGFVSLILIISACAAAINLAACGANVCAADGTVK